MPLLKLARHPSCPTSSRTTATHSARVRVGLCSEKERKGKESAWSFRLACSPPTPHTHTPLHLPSLHCPSTPDLLFFVLRGCLCRVELCSRVIVQIQRPETPRLALMPMQEGMFRQSIVKSARSMVGWLMPSAWSHAAVL
jgi:hypothetical protein